MKTVEDSGRRWTMVEESEDIFPSLQLSRRLRRFCHPRASAPQLRMRFSSGRGIRSLLRGGQQRHAENG
jgi:hypothetical protein